MFFQTDNLELAIEALLLDYFGFKDKLISSREWPVTGGQLPVAGFQLPVSPVADCQLQVTE